MSFLCSSDLPSAWEQVFTWAVSRPLIPCLFIILIAFLPLTLAFWPFLEQLTHQARFPRSVKENCAGSGRVLSQDTSTSAPVHDSHPVFSQVTLSYVTLQRVPSSPSPSSTSILDFFFFIILITVYCTFFLLFVSSVKTGRFVCSIHCCMQGLIKWMHNRKLNLLIVTELQGPLKSWCWWQLSQPLPSQFRESPSSRALAGSRLLV